MRVFCRFLGAALLAFAVTAPSSARDALHRSNPSEPDTLDPQKASIVPDQTVIADLYQGLIGYDEKAEIFPSAAKSWDVSEDGLTYRFHLREGLTWSDGYPVTAKDYEAGIRRLFDPKTASRPAVFAYMIKNAEAVNQGKRPVEDLGVEATDDLTLVVELEHPYPMFTRFVTAVWFFPVPRHVAETEGEVWYKAKSFVGNGPFTLKEWSPNDRIVLEKNPQFIDADSVKLKSVVYFPA